MTYVNEEKLLLILPKKILVDFGRENNLD